VLLDEPGDTVREDARLAAARAGKDQQWPVVGGHGRPLRRVQSGEEIDRPLRGRRGGHSQCTGKFTREHEWETARRDEV